MTKQECNVFPYNQKHMSLDNLKIDQAKNIEDNLMKYKNSLQYFCLQYFTCLLFYSGLIKNSLYIISYLNDTETTS